MAHILEKPGDRLANGFTLVAASDIRPGGEGTVDTRIVLATDGNQYATWMQRVNDGATSNGEYFRTGFTQAADEYVPRCAAHGVKA